ncbi:SRPBCC family protein [Actinospica sp. MGRD01-02]|uniref:SRPBCC family protein n=1 Tax=Actinospica acidithermotolerans TaxID=2828514 RepID=A0A941IIS6_9ACTN|nr:SRPBCC family protein [Actinospica acidithermotolerans]MBR7825056.1 SRPBCC family protein [Actinospica acidithermotolerans]
MDFTNEFRVSLPLESAWELLGDVERIAPCMPGAQLTGVDGDEYRGTVKLKVGPMTTQYLGTATIEERDAEHHTMSLRARGRESRGQGSADATVTASLLPDGDGTVVRVATELRVTGKVAQFGKGVIEDISRKLMDQFATCLERKLAVPGEASAAQSAPESVAGSAAESAQPSSSPSSPSSSPPSARAAAPAAEPEAVDVLSIVRGPLAKRVVPLVLVLVAAAILVKKLT